MTTTLPTTPLEGIDFSQVYDPPTNDYPGLPFALGTTAKGTNGSEYVFMTASADIAQFNAVGVSQTAWTGAPLTKAMADAARVIGFAQVAIANGKSGWVLTSGAPTVTLKNACLPSVPLYTTASAGMLDDTSASQTRVYGVRSQVTSTSSGSAKLCWVQQPIV